MACRKRRGGITLGTFKHVPREVPVPVSVRVRVGRWRLAAHPLFDVCMIVAKSVLQMLELVVIAASSDPKFVPSPARRTDGT